MRAAERSRMVFGADLVLTALGIPTTRALWIRLAGVLVLALATYFVAAVRASALWFMRTSIAVRCFLAAALVGLALAGLVTPLIVLFAIPELAGAAWTAATLRGSIPRSG